MHCMKPFLDLLQLTDNPQTKARPSQSSVSWWAIWLELVFAFRCAMATEPRY